MEKKILEAHLPTWLKAKLLEARRGKPGYLEVGWHLAHHLDNFVEDRDQVPEYEDRAARVNPSKTLRAIFRSEDHPRGDLVDFIPMRRRRDFLRGLLWGAENGKLAELFEQDRNGGWAAEGW